MSSAGGPRRLTGNVLRRRNAQHFLNLLRRVFLAAAENIGPWAFIAAQFVDLSL
jgi:hypothetical protein